MTIASTSYTIDRGSSSIQQPSQRNSPYRVSNDFKVETKNLSLDKKIEDFYLRTRKILYGTFDSIFVCDAMKFYVLSYLLRFKESVLLKRKV